ncbi:MAG: aspartyl-tRNA synthetase [Parcubacteria group bacterium Athens0714_12]|nr:MAG: aspartyl-tRNA synthetase [Parcubacteria group bacterium Athens0714_12]
MCNIYKTHNCLDLNKNLIGQKVKLAGWVHTRRDHGKLIFIDLRDRSGFMQMIFLPKKESYEMAQKLRPEWVISIEGIVNQRPKGMENFNLPFKSARHQKENAGNLYR